MEQEIKQIFEPDEIMKCPHCGEIACVGVNGKPLEMRDAHDRKLKLWHKPLVDIGDLHWSWSEDCANCGRRFNINAVYQVTR